MELNAVEWSSGSSGTLIDAVLRDLKAPVSDEAKVSAAAGGVEIIQNARAVELLATVRQAMLDLLLIGTAQVAQVEDPYIQTHAAYLVIDLDPCCPVIREVPIGTEKSYPTLVDAKEAARQIIQSALATASKSLVDLRQVGVEKITYISL